MYRIEIAAADQIGELRSLFRGYTESLNVDLSFQNFSGELAELPGSYDPILLASNSAGCVALRPLSGTVGEIKRLYVRPEFRGLGLGRALIESVIAVACRKGYQSLHLDTLPQMQEAIALYRRLGFQQISPYCNNPIAGALFFSRDLRMPK